MKLFLIDGHALVFKMYYAFLGRPMVNSKGVDTSILFGFTKYLLEMIQREKPSHLAVSFDPPGGTFRNTLYPEYKANRAETPQLVIDALEPLTKICEALQIPVVMIPGFEADDVIGSMAKKFRSEGFEVYMVTPDKDYGQLVGGGIFQLRPGKSGGDDEMLGAQEVCAKWNISRPEQVIDILTLVGDSADNVPGVQGVGPVGAAKLLEKYGSVSGIYEHLGELTPRQKELFQAAEEHIGLSYKLVTIKTDIPIEVTPEQMRLTATLNRDVRDIFDLYEFRSLRRLLPESSSPEEEAPAAGPSGQLRYSAGSIKEVAAKALASASCGIWEDVGTITMAAGMGDEMKTASGPIGEFRNILEDGSVTKYAYSVKRILKLAASSGFDVAGRIFDVELMHYLLNPERSHSLEVLAKSGLGIELESAPKQSTGSLFDDDPQDDGGGKDTDLISAAVLKLGISIRSEMEGAGMGELYERIEEPLCGVLARMEETGVRIDLGSLRDFTDSLRKRMFEKEEEVRTIAGEPGLNVSSPKQVGEVLFEKMKLDPKAKKPAKGSWPTDEATLSALSDRSPIIDAILDYRGTKKLLSTYIEPLPGYMSPADGRVHTTFNQALTSTGRLSSSNPNLQNIPVRTEEGREIRKAFVPGKPGWVIMSADYSQIELRIMAHLSCDEHLLEAFRSGVDVHAATASKIFGIPVGEVTSAQRRVAKTANFGIMYGISSFGLAERLKCPRGEAKQIIDDYFASFPAIRNFISDTLSSCRENCYVETIFGRRRYIPDVNSHNGNIRALAERNAVNAPIQGSSADIIKLAMIGVDRGLREQELRSRLVLQIHDELVLEVPQEEIEATERLVVSQMEGVVRLSVPLTVECKYGKDWLEAH